jgi:cell division protein FtsB
MDELLLPPPPPRRPSFRARAMATLGLLVWPLLFLGVCAYFAWSSWYGDRGLLARSALEQQIQAARADLTRAEDIERETLRRVQALRSDRLDLDLLDERARHMLNRMGRDETAILYGPERQLF